MESGRLEDMPALAWNGYFATGSSFVRPFASHLGLLLRRILDAISAPISDGVTTVRPGTAA
eukprot:6181196-Pleurochrysis_carterae.AAC.2